MHLKSIANNVAVRIVIVVLSVIIIASGSFAGYVYAASPAAVRNPKLEHYHFRMQVLVNGKAEDFSEDKYQQDFTKDQCNANLPEQPIHFHDNKDQMTHIHWEGMTGGMVMKYYGWNYIGGINQALGYKIDNFGDIQKITTLGNFLPPVPEEAKFYIFTGDEAGYHEQSIVDWKSKNLEEFFGKTSNFQARKHYNLQTSWFGSLFPKASAHGTASDADGDDGERPVFNDSLRPPAAPDTPSNGVEERMTRINNLIGNVVIFVQKDKPNDQQVQDRFNDLEPLPNSTCGG